MNFTTLSAVLAGAWLIRPAYARANMPLVVKALKDYAAFDRTASYKLREEDRPKQMFLPKKKSMAATVTSDVYGVTPYTSTDRLPYNSIAMVDLLGPVLKYGDACTYGTVEYNDLVLRLASSQRVAGIIMNIDGPGGEAAGTAQFAQTIRECSQVKPIIGVIQDGMAASADYWIASACQELYVTQATDQVGSIGAYTTIYDFAGWLELNGIKEIDIYAPQSTDKNQDYLQALKGDDTLIKADLKALVDDFIGAVKTGRGARLNTKDENPFTGKMYSAKDAQKIGLIDGIKPMAGVVKRMENLISLRSKAS